MIPINYSGLMSDQFNVFNQTSLFKWFPWDEALTKENSLNVCLPFIIWSSQGRERCYCQVICKRSSLPGLVITIFWELSREKMRWYNSQGFKFLLKNKNKTFFQSISLLSPTFRDHDQNCKFGVSSLCGYKSFFPASNRFIFC